MLQINEIEMYKINGGASISSQFINAITKAVNTIYSIGQAIGSGLKRVVSGRYCSAA